MTVRPEEQLLGEGLLLLRRLREGTSQWASLGFAPQSELGRDQFDKNATARRQVTWALQRDFQVEDRALLAYALAEEVKWRHEDPWQGIGETLEILAGLAALQRDPANVWVLCRAKQANFDTGCGFDLEHAFAAGVIETLQFVRASTHPEREKVLALLLNRDGTALFDDAAIEEWLARNPGSLPLDPREQALVWLDRALSLERSDLARGFLDEWMLGRERDVNTLASLAYHLENLESWSEASATRKECFPSRHDPFEAASEACQIARLERKAGCPDAAEPWLGTAARLHAEHRDWREIGLGRMFVEECFRSAAALGPSGGSRLFSLAEQFAAETPGLPVVVLIAAVEAAALVRPSRVAHFAALRDVEERRLAELRQGYT